MIVLPIDSISNNAPFVTVMSLTVTLQPYMTLKHDAIMSIEIIVLFIYTLLCF